jgi:hypothetical protein
MLTYKNMRGASGSVDENTINYWNSHLLPRHLEGYSPKDILNADETGIFFNILLQKTLSVRQEACNGGKKSKERISAPLCSNSDRSFDH